MYKVRRVYFISNLINLDNRFCQFQENDLNNLSGQVLSFKGKAFNLNLPRFSNIFTGCYYVFWKINVKKILSEDCYIKFVIVHDDSSDIKLQNHILKYEDVSKLEGLGWIKYRQFGYFYSISWMQFSIEAYSNLIDMQIDYVQIKSGCNYKEKICFPKLGHSLPFHKIHPNVPEAFKDKYFPKKEVENLLELNDIVNNL